MRLGESRLGGTRRGSTSEGWRETDEDFVAGRLRGDPGGSDDSGCGCGDAGAPPSRQAETWAAADRHLAGAELRLHRRARQHALHAALPRRLLHGRRLQQPNRSPHRLQDRRRCRPTSSASTSTPTPYNASDGFSPGATILLKVPGIETAADVRATGAVPINHIGRYHKGNAPVVVIDADDRQALADLGRDRLASPAIPRKPRWRSTRRSTSPPATATSSPCATCRTPAGDKIEAPAALPLLPRQACPPKQPEINARRAHFEAIFQTPAARRHRRARASTSPGTSPSPATEQRRPRARDAQRTPSPSSATPTSPTAIAAGRLAQFQVTSVEERTRTPARSPAASKAPSRCPATCSRTADRAGPCSSTPTARRSRTAPGPPTSTASSPSRRSSGPPAVRPALALRARPLRQRRRGRPRRRSAASPRHTTSSSARPMRSACRNRDVPVAIAALQELSRLPGDPRPPAAGPARRALPRAGDDQPERLHHRPRLPPGRHRWRAPRCSTPATSIYNGNSQGGIMGGALTARRARLHPGLAGRAGDELLGAAAALGRLRPVRRRPLPLLPRRNWRGRWSST